MISEFSIVVLPEDRTTDGNILPEARERIIDSLSEKILTDGDLSPYRLAREMGVHANTAKSLIQETVSRWRTTHENEISFQKEWLRRQITATMNMKATDALSESIRTKTILALFRELNALFALNPEDDEPQPEKLKLFYWTRVGKNMRNALREERDLTPVDENGKELTDNEVEHLQRQGYVSVPVDRVPEKGESLNL